MLDLVQRKARESDLLYIVKLLLEDDLGRTRESESSLLSDHYVRAFHKIDSDPNQYLMVVENRGEVVATSHLTIMPSLTFMGSTRMQIEAVRVSEKYRGQGVAAWMLGQAKSYAVELGVYIIQLTTNKKRLEAKKFYEKLGFEVSHEGMKMYFA